MANKKDDKPRRSGKTTVAVGGLLPIARAAWKAWRGGDVGGVNFSSFATNKAAGGTNLALKAATDAFSTSLTGIDPGLRPGAQASFKVGEAAKSVGYGIAGGVAGKVATRTGLNRTITRVQRLFGMKKAYKL